MTTQYQPRGYEIHFDRGLADDRFAIFDHLELCGKDGTAGVAIEYAKKTAYSLGIDCFVCDPQGKIIYRTRDEVVA